MRKIMMLAIVALVSACSSQQGQKLPRASKPVAVNVDLSRCPALAALSGGAASRMEPVELPSRTGDPLRKFTASSKEQFAVAAQGGGVHCVDIRRMIAITGMKSHQNDRFVSFVWEGFQDRGYRSDGAILVDRAGSGSHIDTGGVPVFSPSGSLVAAVHQSPTAFSALQGFAVWQVGPYATVQVAKIEDLPEMLDWRVDRWESETCVTLSAVPFARWNGAAADLAALQRDHFVARRVETGWTFAPAGKSGC
ncbi:MAG: hypothetical protein M0R03_04690 [Novosphingobium sp.]|nr:hypothetical protein [Novosphingobium sp.]